MRSCHWTVGVVAAIVIVLVFAGNCFGLVRVVRVGPSTTGTLSNIQISFANDVYNVRFTAAGEQSITVAVETDEVAAFGTISVESNRLVAGSKVILDVRPFTTAGLSGVVTRVENIEPISEDMEPDGELWIGNVTTSNQLSPDDGNIGVAGDTRGGLITAHFVNNLTAARHITANVVLLDPISTAVPSVNLCRSLMGNIHGDILAANGRVITVLATQGEIKPPTGFAAPRILSKYQVDEISARAINADITVTGDDIPIEDDCECLRRVAATAGSIRGSITTKILGVPGVANDGIFVTDGQLDANVTTMSNLRRAISVAGTSPAQVSLTNGKVTKIQNGLQSNGSITLAGELEGQIILNTINGTRTWTGPTTINGSTIVPDADFEISQTSATLGGGAIGMAPFRLWKTDSIPAFVDNSDVGPGDGVLETAFVPAGATPVSIRFPGPIQRSTAYSSWTNAFIVQCRPLGGEGSEICDWITVEGGFTFFGPTATTTDTTDRRTIRIGRAAGTVVRPGIYRVIPKVSETTRLNNAVLCADVNGNPPTDWPPSCGPIPGEFDPPIDEGVPLVVGS
ncbi:MAG: hypothetical protein IT438_13000 [Phycisphaerales bacterium]|nr:hypothetical protein [Phycisphaerales bacterium]